MIRLLMVVFSIGLLNSCTGQETSKINGISYVASPEAINQAHIDPVLQINANYAAVMPFGFLRTLKSPDVVYNTKRQWFGETKEGARQYIKQLHKNKIKVMLKPQIWVWRGEFTGLIKMDSEEDWISLEQSYEIFILDYARLAEEMSVNIFCIGTELELFVTNRPDYWKELIKKIRKAYKGKLTYAANWDEFKRTPFWKELDFIGIDAYFPLSDKKTPTVEDCRKGWVKHREVIKNLYKATGKRVLFAEYGYRSVDYTAKEPWRFDRDMDTVNLEGQQHAMQALYDEFWEEDWFAGGFLWKWFHNHEQSGGTNNSRFTPQNKPVEAIIRKAYKK